MRFWALELLFLLSLGSAVAAEPLRGYGADGSSFTVSGLSSGGYMAVQVHVAHSARVQGVAALAAGPYYCAQGSLWTAMTRCMSTGAWTPVPDLRTLKTATESFARERLIDPISNLAKARVWLFSGTEDRIVEQAVVQALGDYYASFGARFVFVKHKAAGHGMVTENAGADCDASAPPFINNCAYDAAEELLRHLFGSLAPSAAQESGRLLAFDQREFADAYAVSMDDDGYAYVPRACETERCRVHVAFHGCRQGAERVGESFVRDAGYNRWADTNRLIVLYPQAIARYWWTYNPRGCWDWWGYTGPRYATKEAPQIRAVLGMVERLAQPRK
jgi:poly(3-hydroxybutyrate) depolymerase